MIIAIGLYSSPRHLASRDPPTPNPPDERKNFSIWYSFYRNRALATLSAANPAFTSLPSSIRMTRKR